MNLWSPREASTPSTRPSESPRVARESYDGVGRVDGVFMRPRRLDAVDADRVASRREDAAEKKVKDAKDLLEQAEKRQREAEALPEGTDPEAAAKASQHAKCAMTIKGCKKQVEAALADQKKVADVEVSRQLERKVEQTSRAVDRLKKDLDAAEKLPDDSAKEKKAKRNIKKLSRMKTLGRLVGHPGGH